MVLVEVSNKAIGLVARFFEKLGLKTAVNAFYNAKQIGRQVLYSALNSIAAEAASQLLKIRLPSNEVLSADRILDYLHSLSSEKMQIELQASICQARDYAKQHYTQPVTVAIDFHEDPYYGDRNDLHVVGTQRKAGTNYAFRYITAEIVEDGKRLCIEALPVYSDDEKPIVLSKVLQSIKRIVKIKLVLLDRGFYGVNCIFELKKARVFFILPVIKDSKMKKLIQEHRTELPWIGTHMLGDKNAETFTVCLKRVDDEVYGFATNKIFDGCSKEETEKFVNEISNAYTSRWGIETGYRVKHFFHAKTTSPDHKIRTLYFFLSVILYNTWVLSNQLSEKKITVFLFNELLENQLVFTPTPITHPP